MDIMRRTNRNISFLAALLAMMWLGGCSTDDIPDENSDDKVSVPLTLTKESLDITRAPGDVNLSVNRVLILPFKKTNESLTNDPVNFAPDYSAAKQVDVNGFPLLTPLMQLTAGSTYQIMAIGYNRNDYDFANPANAGRRFDIGLAGMPLTLADMNLKLTSAPNVPEFYSIMGSGYKNGILVGQTFKPGDINNVKGLLSRKSSGLTLDITAIPAFVKSISLSAEQLVTAIAAVDGTPVQWQTAGDAGVKLLGTLTPVAGRTTFNLFMLPTLDARKTLLYLDVAYGSTSERYTVKIVDNTGVVSGNRVTFTPNHWVRITGTYANINLGFVLSDDINLDDNSWDGIQNY